MSESDFRDSELISANFTEADLSRSLVDRANMTGAVQFAAALNFGLNSVNGEGRPRPAGDLLNVELGSGRPDVREAAGGPQPNNDF